MTPMTESRLNLTISNYRNGNRKEAAQRVRGLTKLELVEMLVNDHRLEEGFLSDTEGKLAFQDFVTGALERRY